MRRLRGDDGAVAVIVALLSVVLLGFGALVIDVGALYSERRQLQAGVDSAAFALAQACAGGQCGSLYDDAESFADANAFDNRSDVMEVCGAGATGLSACTNPPTGLLGSGYVRVTARTEEVSGTHVLPPKLARALVSGYTGTEVRASSVVIWGSPGGIKADFPFVIGNCEWQYWTQQGSTYTDAVVRLYLADKDGSVPCPGSPSGGDNSGGFGFVDGSDADTCSEAVVVGTFEPSLTGEGNHGCATDWKKLVGTVVNVPVYDCQTDYKVVDPDYVDGKCFGHDSATGGNAEYHIVGFAAFHVLGINTPGIKEPNGGSHPCDKCIYGTFEKDFLQTAAPVANGPNLGTSVTQLVQ